ncbi:PREDICTED: killer cell lectin-like receptor subfamily B member 1B allele B [Gekko japonicus]|uniref:Killer cell lectin-like receptor subfamily B member 1B allele B n=1 Tax=Gekko japonicus TaxID=146911 RepID=A0ABM1K9L7_GEKJA|nr:PREDICTED: killer cell lectin-like receptor subfamily B member 1B allele B [Gekko japonicus]
MEDEEGYTALTFQARRNASKAASPAKKQGEAAQLQCQSGGSAKVNSSCQICPPHWHLHQDKCYWLSKALKSWNESQSDCLAKGAQLAVIQVEEMLLKKITEDTHKYWIGLFLSEKKWRLQEPLSSAGEESCGRIKSSTITLDICTAVYKWICQKDPILL